MKILIVSPSFYPEIISSAYIYYDLARSFAKHGHTVTVITSYPRSYQLTSEEKEVPHPAYEERDGVTIHRCRHPSFRDNIVLRGLEQFLLPWFYFIQYRKIMQYRKIGGRFDVCLIYLPPLPFYYFAKMIRWRDGTPTVLNVQDFHPQELTDVGVLENPVLIRIMKYIERTAYRDADFITVLSPGGVEYVVSRGAERKRVAPVYNGVDLAEVDLLLRRKDFKEKYRTGDKFLLSYAGILSPFQGIDSIIDVAVALRDEEDIIFYIAGDGMIRRHLEERILHEKIFNVHLIPFLNREEYFNLVNSSDISFISLDARMRAPCIPGKTSNVLAASQPVIAIVSDKSETARLVREAECGVVVAPGQIDLLKSTILAMKRDPGTRSGYAQNGRRFVEREMNMTSLAAAYEKIFESMVTGAQVGRGDTGTESGMNENQAGGSPGT